MIIGIKQLVPFGGETMDRCLGNCLLRRSLLWLEFPKSLPIGSGSRVYAPRSRAFAIESQQLGSAKGLSLSVFDSFERCFCRKLKFFNDQKTSDIGSQQNLRVLQFFCTKTGNSKCWSSSNRETLSVTDLATGPLDLHGWKVLLQDTKEVVGFVDEIIHIGPADSDEIFESVLKLVCASGPLDEEYDDSLSDAENRDEVDYLEFLVPLVGDIVREVDGENNCLYITPPEGLLELARIPQLLRDLEPKLLEFCQHQNEGIEGCLNSVRASKQGRFSDGAKQLVAWRGGKIHCERFEIFMPTRRQLIAAGKHDLVETIMAAGGFLNVAQSLNLPSRRRPNGFWEDMRNLDAEIEWFVSSSWTKEEDPVTGETVFCNLATGEVSSQEPLPGTVSNPVPVSQNSFDAGTAVMPRQRQVLEAGRYDLHHAILVHGGYKIVAQELGRQPVSKIANIGANIKRFMEEQSMSHFPSIKELRVCGRPDLAYLLRRHGGINAVSDMMDMRPRKYGRGQWSDMAVAAAAIRVYMCNKLILERGLNESSMDRSDLEDMVWRDALRAGTLVIPSQLSCLKDNRSDLRYLLQKFGRKELSQYLGVDFVPRGKKVVGLKW